MNNYNFNPYQQPYPTGADYYRQQMNAIANPYAQQPAPGGQIICRPVTGIEEARAAIIDGINIHLFADIANNKIYLKQISNDGTANLQTFGIMPPEAPAPDNQALLAAVKQSAAQTAALEQRLAQLESEWRGLNDSTSATGTNVKGVR